METSRNSDEVAYPSCDGPDPPATTRPLIHVGSDSVPLFQRAHSNGARRLRAASRALASFHMLTIMTLLDEVWIAEESVAPFSRNAVRVVLAVGSSCAVSPDAEPQCEEPKGVQSVNTYPVVQSMLH